MNSVDGDALLGIGRRTFFKAGAAVGRVGLPIARPMAATPPRKIALEEHAWRILRL